MSSDKLLVTVALPELLGDSEELYLLGSWCRPFGYDKYLKNRNFYVQLHHWSNPQKKAKDYKYLESLFSKVIVQLSIALNHHHNTNYSDRYWQTILGPWLVSYLPLMWDRWEALRVAFNCHDKFSVKAYKVDNVCPPACYDEFSLQAQSEFWNHLVFLDMIDSQYKKNVSIELLHPSGEKVVKSSRPSVSFRSIVRLTVNTLLSVFDFNSKVFFYAAHVNIFDSIRMAVGLKQAPRYFHFDESKYYDFFEDGGEIKRGFIDLNLCASNDFERFLEKRVVKDFPISIIENYSRLKKYTNGKKFKGRVIFSNNAHLHNDMFNIWAAGQVELHKKKMITSQHGGAIKSSMSIFNHQEAISDTHVVWHKPIYENHKQLPPLRRFSHVNKKGRHLLLAGYETGNYVYNAQSGPCCEDLLLDYNQKIDFINLINPPIKTALKVVSKSFGAGYFCSMDRYAKSLNITHPKAQGTFGSILREARVVVCTYPQTTFSESMVSGVPTILLMTKEGWPLHDALSDVIKTLVENNIIFYDHASAARHLNNIWDNVDDWWSSASVLEVRECFYSNCCQVDNNQISVWLDFLRTECEK